MNEALDCSFLPDPACRPLAVPRHERPVVVLGGGTGLSTLLRGLRPLCYPAAEEYRAEHGQRLTAIVTVADDGGSSGRLRRAYPVLAPGDIRNCLLALAGDESRLQDLFAFRFNREVDSHSLGNLIITALAQLESDFTRAVERAGEILGIRGRVLPATPDNVQIEAEFMDGSRITGESRIAQLRRPIRGVRLLPESCRALPQARAALREAALIVIGPGSLYTSLLPTLLVPGIREALAESSARVVLVQNLMTEPGETDGYTPADFVRALRSHLPGLRLDHVLINSTPIPGMERLRYAAQGAQVVPTDSEGLAGLDCQPLFCDLLGAGPALRHDPAKLARTIMGLVQ